MPGPKSDKVWSDAIRRAVHEYHESKDRVGKVRKVRYLNLLAVNLVKAAAGGDMQAMKEVGDRLDGKPSQAIEHKGGTRTVVEYDFTGLSSEELRTASALLERAEAPEPTRH